MVIMNNPLTVSVVIDCLMKTISKAGRAGEGIQSDLVYKNLE
jgi:hypothetical protein